MQLKRLNIVGFKSFPERTHVELVDGVTAIVGPNGCGKTNILDALRWVMGEQRPTLLRGGRMEDVIFNGSQKMKPHAMAEVTLTIENTRGILPTEFNELQLTRRLFRSGESEYLLNKTQCRLKDITELFADTGMGPNAYSVIQQHMIDSLISDKTEDRRILFEEAAGITKYKQRKRAALRKMESTEGDLNRLHDILAEVKTQVNSLTRQMKKAERFQSTREELKELEISLARVTLRALEKETKSESLELEKLRGHMTASETELTTLSAAVESERTEQNEFDSKLADVTRKIQDKTESGHRLDVGASTLKERIQTLGATRERNISDISACDKRIELLSAEETSLKNDLVTRESALGDKMAEIARAQEHSTTCDSQLLSARQNTESETEKLLSLERRISSGKTDTQNMGQQEEELGVRIEESSTQLDELSRTVAAARSERDNATTTLEVVDGQIGEYSAEVVRINDEIETVTQKLELRADQITDLSSALEAAQARIRLLEEMIERHEGFGNGVAAALDNKASWPGLLGAVAELITPQEKYAPAIEAALDDVAGYLVSEDRSTARAIITYLTAEKKGKAVVFSLDGFKKHSESSEPVQRRPLEETGFIGWADRLINPHQQVADLAHSLLCNTAVFDNTLDALNDTERDTLLDRLPAECQVVTTAGARYRGRTVIAGGSEDDLPRFGRQERLDDLEKEFTRLQSELDGVRGKKSSETADVARLRARLTQLENDLESAREDKVSAEKKCAEVGARLTALQTDHKRLEKEKSGASGKLDLLKHRQYTLSLDVDQLSSEKERLMNVLDERSGAMSELEKSAHSAAEELNRLHLSLVEAKSQVQQLTDKIGHQQELRGEVSQTRQSKISENERALVEIENSKEEISRLEEQLKIVFDERSTLTETEAELRTKRDTVVTALREREGEMRDLRARKDSAVKQTHTLELRFAQIENERNNVLARIGEEYDITAEDLTLPPGEPPDTEFETEESRTLAYEKVEQFKSKLKSYGAVNMVAIEEHATASERLAFLGAQLGDLTQAKATLQSTINKINTTARELFTDTFEIARKNFKDIFTELFDGGECDIRLVDESDPLESDIEIIAKPKGKKLVTITQMSGGERALTAISLLFSLYLVKPSPFCILDEIDAPLDDANCHRFLRLIRRFSNQTQFIVITHNKITMEAADTLYGVTMESPGVSKLVSVRFGNEDENGHMTLTRSEVAPATVVAESEVEVPPAVVERMTPSLVSPAEAKPDDPSKDSTD